MSKAVDTAERILWLVTTSKTPARRASSACEKLGRLARRADVDAYFWLASAMNEQMHGMVREDSAERGLDQELSRANLNAASKHYTARDEYMASFKRAASR